MTGQYQGPERHRDPGWRERLSPRKPHDEFGVYCKDHGSCQQQLPTQSTRQDRVRGPVGVTREPIVTRTFRAARMGEGEAVWPGDPPDVCDDQKQEGKDTSHSRCQAGPRAMQFTKTHRPERQERRWEDKVVHSETECRPTNPDDCRGGRQNLCSPQ